MKTTKFVALGPPHEICTVDVTSTDEREIIISGKLTAEAMTAVATAVRVATPDRGAIVEVHSSVPVDGDSCGLAVATAAYTDANGGTTLRDDIVFSGSVNSEGMIVRPGGVTEKREFVESLGLILSCGDM